MCDIDGCTGAPADFCSNCHRLVCRKHGRYLWVGLELVFECQICVKGDTNVSEQRGVLEAEAGSHTSG